MSFCWSLFETSLSFLLFSAKISFLERFIGLDSSVSTDEATDRLFVWCGTSISLVDSSTIEFSNYLKFTINNKNIIKEIYKRLPLGLSPFLVNLNPFLKLTDIINLFYYLY